MQLRRVKLQQQNCLLMEHVSFRRDPL